MQRQDQHVNPLEFDGTHHLYRRRKEQLWKYWPGGMSNSLQGSLQTLSEIPYSACTDFCSKLKIELTEQSYNLLKLKYNRTGSDLTLKLIAKVTLLNPM